MTADFRALCVELLIALENEGYAHWTVPPHEDDLCLRARAALAEPELQPIPVSPAVQAVLNAYRSTHLSINNLAAALRAVVPQVMHHKSRTIILAIADELEATS